MASFSKLSESFDQAKDGAGNKNESPKERGLKAVKQSAAIVRAIDKLKRQGVAITKKAEFDYLLALRVLERANVDPYEVVGSNAPEENGHNKETVESSSTGSVKEAGISDVKRNPADHPEEFKAAMTYSRKIVLESEEMLKSGQPLTEEKIV